LRADFLGVEADLRRALAARPARVRAGGRGRLTLWFEVSAARELVVNATNTGRGPVAVARMELRSRAWRRGRPVMTTMTTLAAGDSLRQTIPPSRLRDGERWVHVTAARGRGRVRRIPAALIGHVTSAVERSS
jgi:hypothetical protein